MTRNQIDHLSPSLTETLYVLREEYGRVRLFRTALKATLFPVREPRIYADDLPPHIQRDIGLTPNADPPGAWELNRR